MNLEKIQSELKAGFSGTLIFDGSRAKFAYYQIGGTAHLIAAPRNFSDLKKIHIYCKETGLPFFFLGWGSNILFSDDHYQGVIIRMKHLFSEMNVLSETEESVSLELGASLGASQLVTKSSQNGWCGFERLVGIPGSVGGMIAMNAGTHLGELSDLITGVEVVNFLDEVLELKRIELTSKQFSYRENHFLKDGDLIVKGYFVAKKGDSIELCKLVKELLVRRKSSQPVDYPSCGSVFMNPKSTGLSAWQVVEKLGLKGHQVGQAQISEKHANFIINLGNAKATDVVALIELVQQKAKQELGIELKREVKFVP